MYSPSSILIGALGVRMKKRAVRARNKKITEAQWEVMAINRGNANSKPAMTFDGHIID